MAENTIEQQLQLTIEGLQADNAKLREENESLAAVNAALTATVEELSKPAAAEAPAAAKPLVLPDQSFQVNKKAYKFICPVFNHDGKRILATEALADKALLEALVKKGSGVIKEA